MPLYARHYYYILLGRNGTAMGTLYKGVYHHSLIYNNRTGSEPDQLNVTGHVRQMYQKIGSFKNISGIDGDRQLRAGSPSPRQETEAHTWQQSVKAKMRCCRTMTVLAWAKGHRPNG